MVIGQQIDVCILRILCDEDVGSGCTSEYDVQGVHTYSLHQLPSFMLSLELCDAA